MFSEALLYVPQNSSISPALRTSDVFSILVIVQCLILFPPPVLSGSGSSGRLKALSALNELPVGEYYCYLLKFLHNKFGNELPCRISVLGSKKCSTAKLPLAVRFNNLMRLP